MSKSLTGGKRYWERAVLGLCQALLMALPASTVFATPVNAGAANLCPTVLLDLDKPVARRHVDMQRRIEKVRPELIIFQSHIFEHFLSATDAFARLNIFWSGNDMVPNLFFHYFDEAHPGFDQMSLGEITERMSFTSVTDAIALRQAIQDLKAYPMEAFSPFISLQKVVREKIVVDGMIKGAAARHRSAPLWQKLGSDLKKSEKRFIESANNRVETQLRTYQLGNKGTNAELMWLEWFRQLTARVPEEESPGECLVRAATDLERTAVLLKAFYMDEAGNNMTYEQALEKYPKQYNHDPQRYFPQLYADIERKKSQLLLVLEALEFTKYDLVWKIAVESAKQQPTTQDEASLRALQTYDPLAADEYRRAHQAWQTLSLNLEAQDKESIESRRQELLAQIDKFKIAAQTRYATLEEQNLTFRRDLGIEWLTARIQNRKPEADGGQY